MKRRTDNLDAITTLRVSRRTSLVLGTIARAKEKSADEFIWEMLERLYPDEIKLVKSLSGKEIFDETTDS
jgi:hypothetical protein